MHAPINYTFLSSISNK